LVSDPADFLVRTCIDGASLDDVALMVLDFAPIERWSFESEDGYEARAVREALLSRLTNHPDVTVDVRAAGLIYGELVANAVAMPGHVDIALECAGGHAVLHAIDRGSGYDPTGARAADALAESGRGLWIIRCLGGKIAVEALPNYGTHTAVVLPAG